MFCIFSETIIRSCQNKANVVAADEKEDGVRATLNLGHTFGHAIETGLGYGSWLHGEAVATGMMMAADMSYKLHWIDESVVTRTRILLERSKLPTTLANYHTEEECASTGDQNYAKFKKSLTTARFLDLMSNDKKVANGQLSLILLKGELGTSVITNKFDVSVLESTVGEYCKLFA